MSLFQGTFSDSQRANVQMVCLIALARHNCAPTDINVRVAYTVPDADNVASLSTLHLALSSNLPNSTSESIIAQASMGKIGQGIETQSILATSGLCARVYAV